MIGKFIKTVVSVVTSIVFAVGGVSFLERTQADEKAPLTLELTEEHRGSGSDYLEIEFDKQEIKGTHIGIKINPVYAVDQNGNNPVWSMFRFIFTDSDGNTWDTDNFNGEDTTISAATTDGTKTSVTWMYSYLWPKQGFYGTMYLPWYRTNGGSEKNPTKAPSDIVKVRIQHNSSYTTARREMLAHFFCLTDAIVDETEKIERIGDVKILEDFDADLLNVTEEKILYDFSATDLESIVWSDNKAMTARFATQEELDDIEETEKNSAENSWKSRFSVSGQKFAYNPVANISGYGNALKWEYGSYYDEYDSALNSYGSLGVTLSGDKQDFAGALGLTVWVKNPQSYPVSFNLEFSEAEEGGAERWNLNGTLYRTLWFYDTVTGEEFSASTLNVAYIPASFCGWVRIPFSQYACPDWSMALEYTDGIYDENKPHTNIYITSQFVVNDNVTMYFDNIGLYYSEFEAGKLFDRTLPSIAECLGGEK